MENYSKLLEESTVSSFVTKNDRSKWFISHSIFCQQEYKVQNYWAKIRFVWL